MNSLWWHLSAKDNSLMQEKAFCVQLVEYKKDRCVHLQSMCRCAHARENTRIGGHVPAARVSSVRRSFRDVCLGASFKGAWIILNQKSLKDFDWDLIPFSSRFQKELLVDYGRVFRDFKDVISSPLHSSLRDADRPIRWHILREFPLMRPLLPLSLLPLGSLPLTIGPRASLQPLSALDWL